jgi:hypothetical protein
MARFISYFMMIILLLLTMSSAAHAQATRTWVSGVGDDVNPCSRTAPCKTFAGAISKTAGGGEIDALDPGGFGAVTITKGMTISGEGTLAGIQGTGTNGIIVNAGVNDVVTIRNVSIHGNGTGVNGIRYIAGRRLVVENCDIQGFTLDAIGVDLTASGSLTVKNTTMTGGRSGISMKSTSGVLIGTADKISVRGATKGIDGLFGAIHVTDSVIAGNTSFGVIAEGGTISLSKSVLTGNNVAAQAQTGSTVRLSDNDVYDNLAGFGCGGGTVASDGTNRKGGNSGGGVLTCSPNGGIAVQ